jgi:hypothetical protein
VLLALVVVAATAFAALLAVIFGFGLQCDESCDPDGRWQDDPSAWQWQLLGWVGVVCLAAAFFLLLAAAAGWSRVAPAALAVWFVLAVALGALLASGLSAESMLVPVVVLLIGSSGVGSVLLGRSQPAR